MLDFVIFAITFVLCLLGLVFYLYPGTLYQTTIPGLNPSNAKEGNLPDIHDAGGVHPFLKELHNDHGSIASFWIGSKLIVSLAEPKLLELQQQVFNKPDELFVAYKPLGESSILFACGSEGRKKRQMFDKLFSTANCQKLFPLLLENAEELCEKWSNIPKDQHIPLYQYMVALCNKFSSVIIFGKSVNDKEIVVDLGRNFKTFWIELEARQGRPTSESDSIQEKQFSQAIDKLKKTIAKIVKLCEDESEKCDYSLVDTLLKKNVSHSEIVDEAIMCLVKHYSVASALTWAFYFLSTHEEVQESVITENQNVLGADVLSFDKYENLKYLKQVIKETLRLAAVEPWTARCQDSDVEISGHIIPKKTPVIHALGVVMHSKDIWKQPEVFDPDRFSTENTKLISTHAFQPFGFAGKRQCPGDYLTMLEMAIVISTVCKKLQLFLVDDQVVQPNYLFYTRPDDEVWIYLSKRT